MSNSRVLAAVLAVLAVFAGTLAPGAGSAAAAGTIAPLPVGARFDYQLGGPRPVPASVGIVIRDRKARPAGRYDICYVNAFQTQPDERAFWRRHWDLVLKKNGRPVVDGAWGEWLLDTRSIAKRARLRTIVGAWIRGCARAGFEAVEFDNLDSFSRSQGLIRPAANVAMARALVGEAHAAGLAAGQKNWAQWHGRARAGFDFAIAEECARWRECSLYARHYGRRVLDVEYRDRDFYRACGSWDPRIAVLRRDRLLARDGFRRWC